jgi:phosphatidylserine/phosphatidylglycerophosphate/cardiolipin synthase-like enzyme
MTRLKKIGFSKLSACFSLLILAAALFFAPGMAASADDGFPGKIRLLANRQYSEALLQGIGNARKSILCTFYVFKITSSAGNQPRRIAEELIRAKKRGVDVTVILESDNGKKDRLTDENRHTAGFLTRGGVKVYFDSPSTVTHVKAVVIDGRYVYLGSHNLTQAALRHNNELSVLIDSPEMASEIIDYMGKL